MNAQTRKPPYSVFAEFYDQIAGPMRGPMERGREEILGPIIQGLRERREREAARPTSCAATPSATSKSRGRMVKSARRCAGPA